MQPLGFGEASWRTSEVPLAALTIHVEVLAERLNVPVYTWQQEGLCSARGFGGRLASGALLMVAEPEHDISYKPVRGAYLMVDATDLASQGVEPLLKEALEALRCSRADVASQADHAVEQLAARWASQAQSP
jgi:hypothetical protein